MAANNCTLASHSSPSPNTNQDESDIINAQMASSINNIVLCYVQPIVSILGIVGNLLSFVVIFRDRRRHPNNVMLQGLAICDTIFLITTNHHIIVCVAQTYDVIEGRNLDVLMTPQMTFVPIVFNRVTGYITALIAIDRALAFTWPLNLKAWVTNRRIVASVFMCYALPIVFHIPLFLRNHIVWEHSDQLSRELPYVRETDLYLDSRTFFDIWKNLILNGFFYILPTVVVTVTTCITSYKIRRQMKGSCRRMDLPQCTTLPLREKRATTKLIIILVIYIVTSLPGIAILTARYLDHRFDYHGRYRNGFVVATNINGLVQVVNSCINNTIYCFTGDKYRHGIKTLFCTKYRKEWLSNTNRYNLRPQVSTIFSEARQRYKTT